MNFKGRCFWPAGAGFDDSEEVDKNVVTFDDLLEGDVDVGVRSFDTVSEEEVLILAGGMATGNTLPGYKL